MELELSEDFKGSVGMEDLKKMDCKQKSKRISNIWTTLTGKEKKTFKKRNIKHNAGCINLLEELEKETTYSP